MQPICYIAFTLLCSLSFLSSELSIQCNKTQYAWPIKAAKFCCNKCPPGKFMVRRQEDSCEIVCDFCMGSRYIDIFNVEMSCKICQECKKPNMQYKFYCNATHNAVCRCTAGYRCSDQPCTECVSIQPIPPSTTTSTTDTLPTFTKPIRDTAWFLVLNALLCTGLAFVVVTKIKPFLHWIRSKHISCCEGYFLPDKPAPVPPCSEDEEVSKPVQEVCGKCDQPIDV
ncbi:CD27 antigen [Xiphias gladius]|uniref:CD27 antigen n=1 Tax=Xiphias gladius TaxID=8245 RepID=UPI001A9868EF|nr:CD27 antigen [Xiphias gladius]XP_039973566.1 CD27 antigen [Xiphias gladius]XP_039973567.1 CD27 antigen [Xiphias gladius]